MHVTINLIINATIDLTINITINFTMHVTINLTINYARHYLSSLNISWCLASSVHRAFETRSPPASQQQPRLVTSVQLFELHILLHLFRIIEARVVYTAAGKSSSSSVRVFQWL